MRNGRPRHGQAGYSYLVLLFVVAVAGLVLAGTGQLWHTQALREKEAELLFVGGEFRKALAAYRAVPVATATTAATATAATAAVGSGQADIPGEWPRSLDDLVLDRRCSPTPCRHLRRIYRDPLTGHADWVFLTLAGRIVGLHSRAGGQPLKQAGFSAADAAFAGARHYGEWRFGDVAAIAAMAGPVVADRDLRPSATQRVPAVRRNAAP